MARLEVLWRLEGRLCHPGLVWGEHILVCLGSQSKTTRTVIVVAIEIMLRESSSKKQSREVLAEMFPLSELRRNFLSEDLEMNE